MIHAPRALIPFTVLAALALLVSAAGAATRGDTEAQAQVTITASERAANAVHEEANENEQAVESENEPEDATGSAGGPHDSTSGARPGFGCGDTNHVHSGPAGLASASPPPGCANAKTHETVHPVGSGRSSGAGTTRIPQRATDRSGGKAGGTPHR
jgi:hypothetical protein